jgi:hypothetical protein
VSPSDPGAVGRSNSNEIDLQEVYHFNSFLERHDSAEHLALQPGLYFKFLRSKANNAPPPSMQY